MYCIRDILDCWDELSPWGDESVGIHAPSGDQSFQVSWRVKEQAFVQVIGSLRLALSASLKCRLQPVLSSTRPWRMDSAWLWVWTDVCLWHSSLSILNLRIERGLSTRFHLWTDLRKRIDTGDRHPPLSLQKQKEQFRGACLQRPKFIFCH